MSSEKLQRPFESTYPSPRDVVVGSSTIGVGLHPYRWFWQERLGVSWLSSVRVTS